MMKMMKMMKTMEMWMEMRMSKDETGIFGGSR